MAGIEILVFSNLHKTVKTSQGSDANPALKKQVFSVCLANQLENQVSKDIPVSQVLREQRKRQ